MTASPAKGRKREGERGEGKKENRKRDGTITLATSSHKTWLVSSFEVSTDVHVEHRQPKAGDAPHGGLLKVDRRGFRCLGV